jgi:hypothetical protein
VFIKKVPFNFSARLIWDKLRDFSMQFLRE